MKANSTVSSRARNISGFLAFVAGFIVLLAPMAIYRLSSGIPLDARGPDWEVWLLIFSGALAAGVGRYVHIRIMTRVFGYTMDQEKDTWRR